MVLQTCSSTKNNLWCLSLSDFLGPDSLCMTCWEAGWRWPSPRTRQGSHRMALPMAATPFTQTSSSRSPGTGRSGGSSSASGSPAPLLFCVHGANRRRGFGHWGSGESHRPPEPWCTGMWVPIWAPVWIQAVLIGGKNSLWQKSYQHCDFQGSIFRDQALFPCSLEISVLRTLTLI